jgi:hypothetical protein
MPELLLNLYVSTAGKSDFNLVKSIQHDQESINNKAWTKVITKLPDGLRQLKFVAHKSNGTKLSAFVKLSQISLLPVSYNEAFNSEYGDFLEF